MGYLTLSGGLPDVITKAVFSLWFRVPAASVTAAHAAFDVLSTDPLNGIIPLICLGPFGTNQPSTTPTTPTVACHTFFHFSSGGPVFTETDEGFTPTSFPVGTTVASGSEQATAPTCIGLNCRGGAANLYINLQTNQKATITKRSYDTTSLVAANTYTGVSGGGYPPGPNTDAILTYTDSSAVVYDNTELFTGPGFTSVAADVWHHLLLSFFLEDVETTGGAGTIADNTSSFSHMWLSVDDVNKTGFDLSDYWVEDSLDLNAVITPNATDIAQRSPWPGGTNSQSSTDPSNYGVFSWNREPAGTQTFSLAAPTIPNGSPVGIPATVVSVSDIQKVELAELQIFTGVSLDSSIEDNRRAFIKSDGTPQADYTIIDGILGKSPEVRLHLATSWKVGINSGTAGNFTKSGTVNTYATPPDITP